MRSKKTKTPLPARRRRALKHLAIAALTVFLVNTLLHMGLLLPIQAIREVEEREGVHGRVVTRLRETAIHRTGLVYLTESEDMVFLGNTNFSILGWQPGFGWAVDCTEAAPLHAASASSSRDGREVRHFYGRVDDPAIETVEVSLRAITGFDPKGVPVYEERLRLTALRGDFLEQEGRRYFLLRCELEDWPEDSGVYAFVRGLDGQGRVLAEEGIDGIYSSYG